MITKNKNKIIISVLSILVTLCMCLGLIGLYNNQKTVSADEIVMDLNEYYVVDSKIVLPASAQITSGDNSYNSSEGYLIYPNGQACALGKEFVLGEIGKYTVRFYYEKDSKTIYAERNFNVLRNAQSSTDCTLNIEVDFTPSTGNKIFSTIGSKIKIFDATVTGAAFSHLDKEVYFNYKTNSQVNIEQEGDEFVTEFKGEYTIVYKAYDLYGNVVIETVSVFAYETDTNEMLSINIEGGLSNLDAVVGNVVQLPTADQIEIDSVNKKPVIEAKAIFESQNYEEEIGQDMQFVPYYAGDWKIVYTATDNYTSVSKTFELNVASTSDLVYTGNLYFDKYYVKNTEYTLDNYTAYTYNGNTRNDVAVDISVKYDGAGNYTKIDGDTLKITGNQSVSFQYSYQGQILYTSQTFKIVDTGYKGAWNIVNYYVAENFTVTATTSSSQFVSNVTSGENTFSFIKAISMSNLFLSFRMMEGKTNYTGLKITLTDYYDYESSVDVLLTFGNDGTIMTIDGLVGSNPGSSFDTSKDLLFNYNNSTGNMCLGSAKVPFVNPFISDKCYISVTMLGIDGNAGLSISKINNQPVNNIRNDSGVPQIYAKSDETIVEVGTTLKTFIPDVLDVLSPIRKADVTISVLAPDKTPVTSVDGIVLDGVKADREYEFVAVDNGNYSVSYSAKDQNNKSSKFAISYLVLDLVAPTIQFVGGIRQGDVIDVVLGTEHVFEQATSTDNLDQPTITAFVISQTQKIDMVRESSFVPTELGIYKVYLRAQDSSFNSSSIYYYINVIEPVVKK